MSGHGNTGKHLGELPKTVQRRLIEQAIARHGNRYAAAASLPGADPDLVDAIWAEMNKSAGQGDTRLARPQAVCKHPCGTYPAYQFHASHGEPIDDACKAVGNARSREYAHRLAERRSAA